MGWLNHCQFQADLPIAGFSFNQPFSLPLRLFPFPCPLRQKPSGFPGFPEKTSCYLKRELGDGWMTSPTTPARRSGSLACQYPGGSCSLFTGSSGISVPGCGRSPRALLQRAQREKAQNLPTHHQRNLGDWWLS